MYTIAVIALLGGIWAAVYLKEPVRHQLSQPTANLKFTDRRLRPFLIMWSCFFLVFISLNVVTAFYIRDKFGVSGPREIAQTASIALVTMAAVITTVQIGVFQLFKPSPNTLIRLFGPLFCVALLTIALAETLTVMFIGYGIIGLAFACATPGIHGGVSLCVEQNEQGIAAGFLAAATTVGPILGPIAGPAVFTIAPNAPMFIGAAIFSVLSLYAFTVKIPQH
jgi:MFS family permease